MPTSNHITNEIDESCSITSGETISKNTFHFSTDIVYEVKSLRILTSIGAPLYAYKTLMQWAHEASMSNYKFDTKNKMYQQTISYLENDLNFHIARPKYVPVTLLPDQLTLDVVVFDVKKMLASLFADTSLNQGKNLVVNVKNRFAKYEPDDDRYGEVNSRLWYQNAYANCIKDPNKDF